jgi:hypothetical protein
VGNGKRAISKAQAKALVEFLKVSLEGSVAKKNI